MEKTNFDNAGVIEISETIDIKEYYEELYKDAIWVVQHRSPYMYQNWTCAFSSKDLALEHIKEQVEWYESQGAIIVKDEWYNEDWSEENEDIVISFDVYVEGVSEIVCNLYIEPLFLNCRDCPTYIL